MNKINNKIRNLNNKKQYLILKIHKNNKNRINFNNKILLCSNNMINNLIHNLLNKMNKTCYKEIYYKNYQYNQKWF